jgi:cytochrome P450
MPWPSDPIAAVTHPDPWDYYADLAARPMHFHDGIGLWVAAAPDDVVAVLTHPDARVRPGAEPVPPHLAGTTAGEVFAGMARFTDGPEHPARRRAIVERIDSFTPDEVSDACTGVAPAMDDATAEEWMAGFPAAVLARLLDLPLPVDEVVAAARALAACFGATGNAAHVEAAEAAIRELPPEAVPFLFQAFDATAGMIGHVVADHDLPAVHNTRRFFDVDATVAGCDLAAGDRVLVVLVTAGLPFGTGPHECPAGPLASTIATYAAGHIGHRGEPTGYRDLANVRVPIWSVEDPWPSR